MLHWICFFFFLNMSFNLMRAEAVEFFGSLLYHWQLPLWCQSLNAISVFKRSLSSREWFCLVPKPNPETGFPSERHQKQAAQTPHTAHIQIPQVICIRDGSSLCISWLWFRLWNLPPPFRQCPQEETPEEEEQVRLWHSRSIQRGWDNPHVHSLRGNQDTTVEGRSMWA